MRRLLLAAVLFVHCSTQSGVTTSGNRCDQSGGVGNSSPNALVCVNTDFTTVNPDQVTVKGNQKVDFCIVGNMGELDVQFQGKTKVHHPKYDGACFSIQAKAVTSIQPGDKYKLVERESGKEIDPTIIIEP